jgi:8-oxo-dGTP pyrophosphatase MutT (NUDIX family)
VMSSPQKQYAALPYRRQGDSIEIMLVTSRDTGRWVIPKGWPIPGLTPRDSAAREAMEEAGLVGRIAARSIGVYHYDKRVADGSMTRCAVDVFVLEVEQQLTAWPEQQQRHTDWFSLEEAAEAVQEVELRMIIQNLRAKIR